MTKSEFQKKVIELLRKYRLNTKMKDKIFPIFSMIDNLSQEEMVNVYNILEEAILAQKESEEISQRLKTLFSDFSNSIKDISNKLNNIQEKLKELKNPSAFFPAGSEKELNKTINGNAMKQNRQSFFGEKPNFRLKLNKLFSAYITEYGPNHVTLVVSDSILYTNNLILRISLNTKNVSIGSSKSLKLYETDKGFCFLITDKPEVIPYGNRKGFYYKNITYEDILNLTNGDFFKVFEDGLLKIYKQYEIGLVDNLRGVGYYKFE